MPTHQPTVVDHDVTLCERIRILGNCMSSMSKSKYILSPPSHWQKSFTTFSLGSSLWLLVTNWKKYPWQFHWQRGF